MSVRRPRESHVLRREVTAAGMAFRFDCKKSLADSGLSNRRPFKWLLLLLGQTPDQNEPQREQLGDGLSMSTAG
jgi:hypothetical protein